MTEEEKNTRLAEIESRIKNLKSNLRYSKIPLEQRNIRSNIGRLEKEAYAIKHGLVR